MLPSNSSTGHNTCSFTETTDMMTTRSPSPPALSSHSNHNNHSSSINASSRKLPTRSSSFSSTGPQPPLPSVAVTVEGVSKSAGSGTNASKTPKRTSSFQSRFGLPSLLERFTRGRMSSRSQPTTSAVPVAVTMSRRDNNLSYSIQTRLSGPPHSSNLSPVPPAAACSSTSEPCPPTPETTAGASHTEETSLLPRCFCHHPNNNNSTSQDCDVCYTPLSYVSQTSAKHPGWPIPDNQAMSYSTVCGHVACLDCWRSNVVSLIENYRMVWMTCLACSEPLEFADVAHILSTMPDEDMATRLLLRYDNFLLYRALALEPDLRWCPTGGCGYAVIASDRTECPMLFCDRPFCRSVFCAICRDFWHAGSCRDSFGGVASGQSGSMGGAGVVGRSSSSGARGARNIRGRWPSWFPGQSSTRNPRTVGSGKRQKKEESTHRDGDSSPQEVSRGSPVFTTSRQSKGNNQSVITDDGEVKSCPRCRSYVLKMDDGTCNHMVCIVCGCEFCWLCMREITDMHFLSPSGCTFWGRKQWSFEKRILWQLGTLIGAPIGIGFLAAVAVPAIIIGIPVYVARKVYDAYKPKSRHKQRLAVLGGAAAALLLSPFVAALTVGIGVPLMLAYVYVVMPVALCRATICGSCVVQEEEAAGTTTAAGGNTTPPPLNTSNSLPGLHSSPHIIDPSGIIISPATSMDHADQPTASRAIAFVNERRLSDPVNLPSSSTSLSNKNTMKVTADIAHWNSDPRMHQRHGSSTNDDIELGHVSPIKQSDHHTVVAFEEK